MPVFSLMFTCNKNSVPFTDICFNKDLRMSGLIQKITIMEVEPAKLTWLAEAPPAGSNLQLRIWAIDYRRLLDCKSLPILGIGD
ncbi:Protein of unknown function [Gryllus bimaculatus]|nr:Protein of unknown function [Gryllus bimaculatus]